MMLFLLTLLFCVLPYKSNAADTLIDEMPIVAWYGVPEQHTSQEAFRTFRDCGFTVSLFPYSSLENLVKACRIAKQQGIKIIGSCPEIHRTPREAAAKLKVEDGFSGYLIQDEPSLSEIKERQKLIKKLQDIDHSHLFYINLYPYSDPKLSLRNIKAKSYQDYLKTLTSTSCQQISFDFYPITTAGIRPTWYQNLEMIRQESQRTSKPFWGFVLSIPHDVPCVPDTYYPTPTLAALRLQVYSNLAYGAQAIQYFTYWTPNSSQFHYHDAPIDVNGKKTKTWTLVQQMNRELKMVSKLFYGARVVSVHHLGGTLPEGTTRPTRMIPNLKSLKVIGTKGAIITEFIKDNHRYLAIVNKDYEGRMKVRLKYLNNTPHYISKQLKEYTPKEAYTIQEGDILLFRLK